jgi:transcriptional regulator EpsA
LAGVPVEGASPLDIEALIAILDASLRVHARSHFIAWTQGPLHSLLRQDVLICMLPVSGRSSFRIDCFSTLVAATTFISDPLARDASLARELIEIWRTHDRRPVLVDRVQSGIIGGSALASALERVAATQVVMHGCHDVAGNVTGFFVFACCGGTLSPRHLHHVQLVVPFLHAAWTRAQLSVWPRSDALTQKRDAIVTKREQEVLRWIYLGKTNGEIGCILGISAQTVKDHVQNLLRKLNVVNRTQAVGKAIDAQLL